MRNVPHSRGVKPPQSKVLLDRSQKVGAVVVPVAVMDQILTAAWGLHAAVSDGVDPELAAELEHIARITLGARYRQRRAALDALVVPPATVAEAAAVLGVTARRVRQMISAGDLPATRRDGTRAWEIERTALAAATAQRQERCGRAGAAATVVRMTSDAHPGAVPFQRAVLTTHDLPEPPVTPTLARHGLPAGMAPETDQVSPPVDWSTATKTELDQELARVKSGRPMPSSGSSSSPAAEVDWSTATPEQVQAEMARMTGRRRWSH